MSDQQCSRLSWADPVGQAQQVFRLALTALSRPAQAAFAFVPGTEALPDLRCFHQGEAEYPDRSTTICLG